MKILIDSFNTVCQNPSGGVNVRIKNFIKNYDKIGYCKLFNKWNDRLDEYDVLHIFKANPESYNLVKLAKKNNIPIVVSSVVPQKKKNIIKANQLLCKLIPVYTEWYMLGYVLEHANAIIAQTEKEKKFILKCYDVDENLIHVIPNGISLDLTKQKNNLIYERLGYKDEFALVVGRFDENKNQLNVIRALKDTDIKIVFIGGPGSDSVDYFEKCKQEANQNTTFLGWMDHDDPLLLSAYQNAQTVILPSYFEIFGNSLIEGGACGANMVATSALPLEEWKIDKYCWSFDPNNTDEILKAVLNSMTIAKSDKASKLINTCFSWEAVVNKHFEVYSFLVQNEKNN